MTGAGAEAGRGDGDYLSVTTVTCTLFRYGLDSIASVFFGLDVDTITHRRHEFRIIEKLTNNRRYMFNLVPILIFLCPG